MLNYYEFPELGCLIIPEGHLLGGGGWGDFSRAVGTVANGIGSGLDYLGLQKGGCVYKRRLRALAGCKTSHPKRKFQKRKN